MASRHRVWHGADPLQCAVAMETSQRGGIRNRCFRSIRVDVSLVKRCAQATLRSTGFSSWRCMRRRVFSVWGRSPIGRDTPPSDTWGPPSVVGSWLVLLFKCQSCPCGHGISQGYRGKSHEEPAPHTPTTRSTAALSLLRPCEQQHGLNSS